MRAEILNLAEYKRWTTSNPTPNAAFNPYVISERVPAEKVWIVLALSAFMPHAASTQFLRAFAVPPPISDMSLFSQNPSIDPDFSFVINTNNLEPILSGGVLVSKGSGIGSNEMNVNTPGGNPNSVNLLRERFVLPPLWALAVLQDKNAGGGSNFVIVLSAMIIAMPLAEAVKDSYVAASTVAASTVKPIFVEKSL